MSIQTQYSNEDDIIIDLEEKKTKRGTFSQDNEMIYMIDPSRKLLMSKKGKPVPQEQMYLLNPNKNLNLFASDGEYMMFPKSNRPILSDHYEQKTKLKIYPHMFQQYVELKNERKEVNYPKTHPEAGAIDYPIPMRFQLQYLQQPPASGNNLDYDMIIKEKSKELPEFSSVGLTGKSIESYANIASPPGVPTLNRQRMINLHKNHVNYIINQQELANKYRNKIPFSPNIIQGELSTQEEQAIEESIRKVPRKLETFNDDKISRMFIQIDLLQKHKDDERANAMIRRLSNKIDELKKLNAE